MDAEKPPFRALTRPPAEVTVTLGADGVQYLDCPRPLPAVAHHILDHLDRVATTFPDRPYLMRRATPDGEWLALTYGETAKRLRDVAQGLLDLGLERGDRVMILSANSFEHALLTFATMQIGMTVVPVSPAYSLLSQDLSKLQAIHDLTHPRLIFAQHGGHYGRALATLAEDATNIVCAQAAEAVPSAITFEQLVANPPGPAVEAARRAVDPDAAAKILFTSGSTGLPKGAINTQRMLCSSQAMLSEISEPVDPDQPPVLLDWLPWHHTFGGNTNLHRVMVGAGTLYMDEGKPTPELFGITIANLREVAPTVFSTVPGAYAPLAAALEDDPALRRNFFSRLQSLSYGGAPLSQDLYERMQALAIAETGLRIPFTTGHGMTETPLDVAVYWDTERVGLIGLPIPGTRIKLVPHGDKFEMRLYGPQVTPGYFDNPGVNQAAFDDEGFFKTGDAVTWVDADRPAEGLVFAGRLAEEFKLANGSWVNVGTLRLTLLAALTPLVSDLLLTGEEEIGLLAWPNAQALAALCPGLPVETPLAELIRQPAVIDALTVKLAAHNAAHPGATRRVARAMLLATPPSLDAGEVTDKRSINQATALRNRADDVARLFAEPPGDDVIVLA